MARTMRTTHILSGTSAALTPSRSKVRRRNGTPVSTRRMTLKYRRKGAGQIDWKRPEMETQT
jgi:hypothetical protein